MDSQQTALYSLHKKLNAKIVDFHGWLMPVQYSSIIQEHNAVRGSAGLFDVSHMGEFIVEGAEAEQFLQWIVTGDVKRLIDGRACTRPCVTRMEQSLMICLSTDTTRQSTWW